MEPSSKSSETSASSLRVALTEDDVYNRGVDPTHGPGDLKSDGRRHTFVKHPGMGHSVSSPCGDDVKLQAEIGDDGIIYAMRHQCMSCCLTKAIADVVCEAAYGQHVNRLADIDITAPPISMGRADCVEVVKRAAKDIYTTWLANNATAPSPQQSPTSCSTPSTIGIPNTADRSG